MKVKALRCLVAALALVFLLPATAAVAAPASAPAAAPATVHAAAPAVAPGQAAGAVPARLPQAGIWDGMCNIVLTPILGTAGGKSACVAGKILAPAAKSAVTRALQSTIVKPMADGAGEWVAQVLKVGLTWWLTTPSVQVKNSGVTDQETGKLANGTTVTFSLQAICLGVGQMIAILLVMIQGIRAMIQRKGKPLADAAQGLVVNALVCTLGIVVIDSLLIASDELTNAIINVSFQGDAKLADQMVKMMVPIGFNPMALLLMALITGLVGVVQFCMLFIRQAAIPVQALLLPIAGSGQVGGERTRQWLPRLWTSIFVVIAYKPCAALIISIGFVEVKHGNGIIDWLRGLVTLGLSIVALKSLMGLFAPLGTAVAGATSGGFAGALAGVGAMIGMVGRGGGGGAKPASAVQHASAMSKAGPAAGTGGAALANPYVAAAAAGVSAVNAARNAAGGAMAGSDGGGVPQQGGRGQGQGQNGQSDRAQSGGDTSAPSSTGGGTVPSSGASTASGAHSGVQIAVRAAEAGGQAARGAGNTMSEGSRE